MLNGISTFEWKRVENLVNCQQLMFTEIEWHSKYGSNLCKNCGQKHHRAFVKVVEGSEIYNFPIHQLVHFCYKILS
jgi:protein-arginine kinase activator protein McsA